VEKKEINLEREKVSERVEIGTLNSNEAREFAAFKDPLCRGGMIETLRPEDNRRACFFDVGDVLPSVD